jgi:hypothetical protein
LVVTISRLWLRIFLREDQKLKKSRYLLWGIWHGLQGRLGKIVDPARG